MTDGPMQSTGGVAQTASHLSQRPDVQKTRAAILLDGQLTLDRRLLRHPIWLQKPFSEGQAMVDLFALANNRDSLERMDGRDVPIARGCCAWTERGLADRWGWGRTKTRGFLASLERRGTIEKAGDEHRPMWRVVNYETYNQPDSAQTAGAPRADHPRTSAEPPANQTRAQNREIGIGNREGGGDEGCYHVPDDGAVMDFGASFAGEPASGAPGPMPPDWVAERLREFHGRREFPIQWKRLLIAAWRTDFRRYQRSETGAGKKNGAPRPAWATAAGLRERIERHPANSRSAFYNPNATPDQEVEFKKMRADLRALHQEDVSNE